MLKLAQDDAETKWVFCSCFPLPIPAAWRLMMTNPHIHKEVPSMFGRFFLILLVWMTNSDYFSNSSVFPRRSAPKSFMNWAMFHSASLQAYCRFKRHRRHDLLPVKVYPARDMLDKRGLISYRSQSRVNKCVLGGRGMRRVSVLAHILSLPFLTTLSTTAYLVVCCHLILNQSLRIVAWYDDNRVNRESAASTAGQASLEEAPLSSH